MSSDGTVSSKQLVTLLMHKSAVVLMLRGCGGVGSGAGEMFSSSLLDPADKPHFKTHLREVALSNLLTFGLLGFSS